MGEGAVGLCHFVKIVPFFNSGTLIGGGFLEFRGKGLRHRDALAFACKTNDPAHRKGKLTIGWNFHRNLVSGSAYAAALNLKAGASVVHGLLKNIKRINRLGAITGALNSCVNNTFRKGTFASAHDGGDKAGNQRTGVTEITLDLFCDDAFAAGHGKEKLECCSRLLLFLAGLGFFTWLGALGSVLGASTTATVYAKAIKTAANDMIPDSGEILHTASAYEHD